MSSNESAEQTRSQWQTAIARIMKHAEQTRSEWQTAIARIMHEFESTRRTNVANDKLL